MKPPAFQFYPDDFIGGTVDLSAEQCGGYIRLLCYQWGTGRIPETKEAQDRVAGCSVCDQVLGKFPRGKNKRLEEERRKQSEYRAKQALKGRASAKARFNRGSTVVQPSVVDIRLQPEGNSPSPSPNNKDTASATPSPPPTTIHAAFIDGWVKNFKAKFGFDYAFDGGRDGKAVRELLRMAILPIDILEIAKQAWSRAGQSTKSFNCEQASTIHGFKSYFNQIRTELQHGSNRNTGRQGVDRNAGTLNTNTSGYSAAARSKAPSAV